jgi:hypothetical protein
LATYVSDPLDPAEMANAILAMLEARQKYTPSPDQIAKLRATYSPEHIACEYYALLTR